MKLAKKKGAATIAITNFEHSLIAGYADILLCTSSQQLLYGNAIFSRMSQTAVVDMIYMGIILRDYGHFTGKLDESSRIILRAAGSYGGRHTGAWLEIHSRLIKKKVL